MSNHAPSRSLSGKRLTIVLMIILLGTGGLFYWVTTAYTTYNAARRQTDRDWRALATLLENRYREFDQRITAAVEQQKIEAQLGEQWRAARDAFTGTGISDRQIESATKVEAVIDSLPDSIAAGQSESAELKQAVEKYELSAQQQRQIGQTAGSKLLKIMLNLPDPKDIEL